MLLFLIAEQFADASDAAKRLDHRSDPEVVALLRRAIKNLGEGRILRIYRDGQKRKGRRTIEGQRLAEIAEWSLAHELLTSVEQFAAELLNEEPFDSRSAASIVDNVLSLTTRETNVDESRSFTTGFPGPHQLATLLDKTMGTLRRLALVNVPPPRDSDGRLWSAWLAERAKVAPFVWPNHFDLLFNDGFQDRGKSAVLVLPTGAGKTSVVMTKIAATLQAGQKVVFLAPTHALVEQLTEELGRVFDDVAGLSSNPLDGLFVSEQLSQLEVMTPERCLALLSFAPSAFENLGLLIFDECHLLSPDSGVRRSIDAMFSLLKVADAAPQADWVLMSAMVENGKELARWIEAVTSRPCIFKDSLWKPTRQVRGVVAYSRGELESAAQSALATQAANDRADGRRAKSLRAAALRELKVRALAIFGLVHNWLYLDGNGRLTANVSSLPLLPEPVQLGGKLEGGSIRLLPNTNGVASAIASQAAKAGLKTIVFVNTRPWAVSVAANISSLTARSHEMTRLEQRLWDEIVDEIGSPELSLVDPTADAVPHHSQLLRHERRLAEMLFRRPDGARTIVATPTLAQGLNLPAQIAILSGDHRMNVDTRERTQLEAHEILNAAARAGRAGHLANGIVLLVPEPQVALNVDGSLDAELQQKLRAVLPDDDRCITISDPLSRVLDRFAASRLTTDEAYGLNRLLVMDGESRPRVNVNVLRRSFAFYRAQETGTLETLERQFEQLVTTVESIDWSAASAIALEVSGQSGLSPQVVSQVETFGRELSPAKPKSTREWLTATIAMLDMYPDVCRDLAGGDYSQIEKLTSSGSISDGLRAAHRGARAWIDGSQFRDIEASISEIRVPDVVNIDRARKLVLTLVPRTLSYAMQLLTSMCLETFEWDSPYQRAVAETAVSCLQKGVDTPVKLAFAATVKSNPTRRTILAQFDASSATALEPFPTDDYATILSRVRAVVGASL
ncbi:DEAD/DEAH box helicase [Leifsonia sp. 22587]|uniref:DEAD/DEAH box helicase n=1 Tax=Leifsonia sp. 22587 TaxID=3453946 RepID=UPI003F86AE49